MSDERTAIALEILDLIEEFTDIDAEYLCDPDDPESEVMLSGSGGDHAQFLYELMERAKAFDAPRARLFAAARAAEAEDDEDDEFNDERGVL